MFGEIAAIDRKPRSASIEAREPCTIASLSATRHRRKRTAWLINIGAGRASSERLRRITSPALPSHFISAASAAGT
jgi:CRP-like cAMP-binding protein